MHSLQRVGLAEERRAGRPVFSRGCADRPANSYFVVLFSVRYTTSCITAPAPCRIVPCSCRPRSGSRRSDVAIFQPIFAAARDHVQTPSRSARRFIAVAGNENVPRVVCRRRIGVRRRRLSPRAPGRSSRCRVPSSCISADSTRTRVARSCRLLSSIRGRPGRELELVLIGTPATAHSSPPANSSTRVRDRSG